MNRPIRQGDIMLFPIKKISEGLTALPSNSRLVLARGSTSNHEHIIEPSAGEGAGVKAYGKDGEIVELEVTQDCTLFTSPTKRHEPLPVAAGCYRLIHQVGEIDHKQFRVLD